MSEQAILIVEDETRLAQALAQGLREEGHQVSVASDGIQGWLEFQSGQFDLVLLDINLPKQNGYSLCASIRSLRPQVPVIMLTALGQLEDKVKGYSAGADDYMVKPFEFRELRLKVGAILRRAATRQEPELQLVAADLVLDLNTREAMRGGQPIRLTAKEFQLLEFLVRNANRVVSRADIAFHVWEINFETNTNYIDVYISYLRGKVDKPFPEKLIHTLVGMGYVLRA
ncbi:response regulator transcription factor [Flaviaesturariibacter flavus]|uniref:Response regulator transcription factor n=1 Tax=Flaviaesturariibacter flavus TaxID=2502780 RepID=A0A4R1BC05_9BACT|nr:response regulator transcription factor [Flaviaesturariibacter flavus]TCJ14533.1 response regulator transcription factor [Flaviaesturariibacter flavus]